MMNERKEKFLEEFKALVEKHGLEVMLTIERTGVVSTSEEAILDFWPKDVGDSGMFFEIAQEDLR